MLGKSGIWRGFGSMKSQVARLQQKTGASGETHNQNCPFINFKICKFKITVCETEADVRGLLSSPRYVGRSERRVQHGQSPKTAALQRRSAGDANHGEPDRRRARVWMQGVCGIGPIRGRFETARRAEACSAALRALQLVRRRNRERLCGWKRRVRAPRRVAGRRPERGKAPASRSRRWARWASRPCAKPQRGSVGPRRAPGNSAFEPARAPLS